MPGWRSGITYSPEALALLVRAAPVPTDLTVTLVAGRSAPLLSEIVPPMAPVVDDCAIALRTTAVERHKNAKRTANKIALAGFENLRLRTNIAVNLLTVNRA